MATGMHGTYSGVHYVSVTKGMLSSIKAFPKHVLVTTFIDGIKWCFSRIYDVVSKYKTANFSEYAY